MDFEIKDGELLQYSGSDPKVVIPEGVVRIRKGAFKGFKTASYLSLPSTLAEVEVDGFGSFGFDKINVKSIEQWLSIKINDKNGPRWIKGELLVNDQAITELVIPEGTTVIEEYRFCGCRDLKKVTFPNSVVSIETSAFEDCPKLQSVAFPNSLKSIKKNAFSRSGLSIIHIPPEVEAIEVGTFSLCKNLEKVIIPHNVKKIQNAAFSGCENLREIVLEGTEEIGFAAFRNCLNLASISLPTTLMKIGKGAFDNCLELKKVLIADIKSWLKMQVEFGGNPLAPYPSDEMSIYINKAVLEEKKKKYTPGTELVADEISAGYLVIPEGIEEIRNDAFHGCTNIKKVTIPSTTVSIGGYAFAFSKITEMLIPKTVKSINGNAFYGCKDLKTVIFESVPESLGEDAFGGCGTKMQFPDNAFATKNRISTEWAKYNLLLNDFEIAHIILFQNAKAWKEYIKRQNINNVNQVFIYMVDLYQNNKKASDEELAEFMIKHARELDSAAINNAIKLLSANKYKNVKELKANKDISDRLAGNQIEINPVEEQLKIFISNKGKEILPEALKAVKKGLPYASDGRISSIEVVAFVISESIREWNRIKSVQGDFNTEYLKDGKDIVISQEMKIIGGALNREKLSFFLETLVEKQTYRPYLIAWAYFADDQGVERMTADYKSLMKGNSKDRYRAGNFREALLVNSTNAAKVFFDKIGILDRYAKLRGTSAMTMRDTEMLPSFGFDSDGIKRYDIGGKIIEVSITSDLGFRIFDTEENKELRSFPKKGTSQEKLDVCTKEFAEFKKGVLAFAKERSELLHKMHLSGEFVEFNSWQDIYLGHPVIRHLGQLIIWQDASGTTFTVDNNKLIDAQNRPIVPSTKIRVAHVVDMSPSDIVAWQKFLANTGKKLLFEQVWEPIVTWDKNSIVTRYESATLTSDERNALKKVLKQHGIESNAADMDRTYNYRTGKYEFSNKGVMNYGNCLKINYIVDEKTKGITFGKASTLAKPGSRQINSVLVELDKATVSSQVAQDHFETLNEAILENFTVSQISMLIDIAATNKAVNCTAKLLDFKNTRFPEYLDVNGFTLDW